MKYNDGDMQRQIKETETETNKYPKEEQGKFDEWVEKVLKRFCRVE